MHTVTNRPCPGCKGTNGKRVGDKNGFLILICPSCLTLFTSSLPASDEREDYDEYYSEANLVVPEFVETRVRQIVGEFEPHRQINRLLDIGFGAGTILKIAEDLGWHPCGTEVSKPAVEFATANGFEVYHGELAETAFPSGHFDVVTASEIIEHVMQPDGMLKEIVRILRPGGLFWGTTPSSRSLSFRIMSTNWTVISPPEHVQLYSKKAIREMLFEAGFSKVEIHTAGLNPAEIVQHFRRERKSTEGAVAFNRVSSSYQLNEALTRSPLRRFVKSSLNSVLDLFNAGDSLKITAQV